MPKKKPSISPADIPVVILAGGRGTRLMEETQVIPKPMVTIGGKPILLHIMLYYSAFGFRRFVICLGYKGHVIKEYFLNLHKHTASLVIQSRKGKHVYDSDAMHDWDLALVETGEQSLTGTRLRKVKDHIKAPRFCLTYGDGLCDLDLSSELKFHMGHGRMGTVAAVHPPSRFGKLDIGARDVVQSFREKEVLNHDYVNGGFFIFESGFVDRLSAKENQSLESDPLSRLADDGQLCAFKHDGFWQCMDTIRDRETLEKIHDSGKAPWVIS